jgi:hypothetical protein
MGSIIKADWVEVVEGNLYEVMGESDVIVTFNCLVAARVGETFYYHKAHFPGHVYDEDGWAHVSYSHKEAAELVDRIRAAGLEIDLQYWNL